MIIILTARNSYWSPTSDTVGAICEAYPEAIGGRIVEIVHPLGDLTAPLKDCEVRGVGTEPKDRARIRKAYAAWQAAKVINTSRDEAWGWYAACYNHVGVLHGVIERLMEGGTVGRVSETGRVIVNKGEIG